ncbi:MAG: cadherin-like domain-containing protein, partial [Deltaproteobacteria bacterium]|nr:cadherin-like domain-containing protein [Deltaproteobacteria bacterium]
TEDAAYTINAADLLQGYSDVDGDTLSVTGLTASVGTLANNNDCTWTLTAPQDFNGKVDLTYSVSDGNGASTAGSQSFSLTPVNDAPVVSGVVDLGSMLEDGSFRITSEQLLANASDVDGDTLSVTGLKLASGQGSITDNGDGSWTFAPSENWNGESEFTYAISDITNNASQAPLRDSEVLAATWGTDQGIGILDTESNKFTRITSASYQGMLGDEVIANRKGGKEAFIRQSEGIKGIRLETGEERILHIESAVLIGYNKNEDSLVTYNFVSDEISETNLTTLETATKAASVLQGASVQAGGFAGFSAETNTATLLTRDWNGEPQSVLTSINLNTGEKSQVTAEGLSANLQAISSRIKADSVFGVWQDEETRGFLQIGKINTKTGAVTALAQLETGTSGGFSNYNFDVNEAGIAFIHHSGEKDGEWGSWITSVDTKDGSILGSVNNPGDILRGTLTDIANPSFTVAGANLTVNPVNDAPVVKGIIGLGSMLEDGTFRITSEQLLANASDVDGDTLS